MGKDVTIKEYIIDDLDKLTSKELSKVYKYIRTHHIAEIPNIKDPLSTIWCKGRAFVYAEVGEVEYFDHFLNDKEKEQSVLVGEALLKSRCGGIRPLEQCRPLDYIRGKD